jgi:lipoic acid synthetase
LTLEFPAWLSQPLPNAEQLCHMERVLGNLKLHTICESGGCPNWRQCFPDGVAFLILGNICTRNCSFCAVAKGSPYPPDPEEPAHIVDAARQLKLDYIFITSVTRDDLPDGGAAHYADTIRLIHTELPEVRVEVLIPDFKGDEAALKKVVQSGPTVICHNIETVPRLYAGVRPLADYRRSLNIFKMARRMAPSLATKSGLMLGLGETRDEVISVMRDLREYGCDILTLGQYLAPSRNHHPVVRFVTPQEFTDYEQIGVEEGFRGVASAPIVRSSFKAAELYGKAFNV